jgi:hypothetical protein
LPRGGFEQVFAANDLGDSHRSIIYHDRQLIRGHVVVPPDYEIAKILSGHELLRAEPPIYKGNDFTVGNAEAPIYLLWRVTNAG